MQKEVIFIDESRSQRRSIKKRLSEAYGSEISVRAIAPMDDIGPTIASIKDTDNQIVALFFDEILEDQGAKFSGSSLASAYREIDDLVPIYILTTHIDSVAADGGDYEYVIDKTDVARRFPENLIARLRRHVNQFEKIILERNERLDNLLKKSILDELTTEESQELDSLIVWRERPLHMEEHSGQVSLSKKIEESADKLALIEEKLRKLDI